MYSVPMLVHVQCTYARSCTVYLCSFMYCVPMLVYVQCTYATVYVQLIISGNIPEERSEAPMNIESGRKFSSCMHVSPDQENQHTKPTLNIGTWWFIFVKQNLTPKQ